MPGSREAPVDPRIAALFAEPPERFVAARNALARELAAARDPASATVRGLKRPTRRTWILNRLARERPRDVEELVAAGGRLRDAHAAVVRGDEDAGLREADQEMSARLDALVVAANRLLAGGRQSADHALLVNLRSDLRTIATQGGADADRLRAAAIEVPPHVTVEDVLGAGGGPSTGRGTSRRSTGASDGRRAAPVEKEAIAARSMARAELRRAQQELARAERELERQQSAARKAEALAGAARDRADEASRARDEARRRLVRAESAMSGTTRPGRR